eukprot:bmy_17121T0
MGFVTRTWRRACHMGTFQKCCWQYRLVEQRLSVAGVVSGLKQRILKLEQRCKEKDHTIDKLQTDMKTTNLEEMRIAMETYYEEIHRLQTLLASSETTGKKPPAENKIGLKRQKKMSSVLLRLSRSVQELTEENQSLREDLDRVLSNSPTASTIKENLRSVYKFSRIKLVRKEGRPEVVQKPVGQRSPTRRDADISGNLKKISLMESPKPHASEVLGSTPPARSASSSTVHRQPHPDGQEESERLRGVVKRLKGERSALHTQLQEREEEIQALTRKFQELEESKKGEEENAVEMSPEFAPRGACSVSVRQGRPAWPGRPDISRYVYFNRSTKEKEKSPKRECGEADKRVSLQLQVETNPRPPTDSAKERWLSWCVLAGAPWGHCPPVQETGHPARWALFRRPLPTQTPALSAPGGCGAGPLTARRVVGRAALFVSSTLLSQWGARGADRPVPCLPQAALTPGGHPAHLSLREKKYFPRPPELAGCRLWVQRPCKHGTELRGLPGGSGPSAALRWGSRDGRLVRNRESLPRGCSSEDSGLGDGTAGLRVGSQTRGWAGSVQPLCGHPERIPHVIGQLWLGEGLPHVKPKTTPSRWSLRVTSPRSRPGTADAPVAAWASAVIRLPVTVTAACFLLRCCRRVCISSISLSRSPLGMGGGQGAVGEGRVPDSTFPSLLAVAGEGPRDEYEKKGRSGRVLLVQELPQQRFPTDLRGPPRVHPALRPSLQPLLVIAFHLGFHARGSWPSEVSAKRAATVPE